MEVSALHTRLVAVLLAAAVLGGCSSSVVETAPIEKTQRTNEQLAVAWWTWAATEPDATNPLVDETGEDCARNQPTDVWFLAGNFGGETVRSCDVPAGVELFMPVLNAICPPEEACDEWFDNASQRSAVLDDADLVVTEIDTGPVSVTTVEGNSVNRVGGAFTVLVAGWWVRVPPLDPGEYTLTTLGVGPDGWTVSVEYRLSAS